MLLIELSPDSISDIHSCNQNESDWLFLSLHSMPYEVRRKVPSIRASDKELKNQTPAPVPPPIQTQAPVAVSVSVPVPVPTSQSSSHAEEQTGTTETPVPVPGPSEMETAGEEEKEGAKTAENPNLQLKLLLADPSNVSLVPTPASNSLYGDCGSKLGLIYARLSPH